MFALGSRWAYGPHGIGEVKLIDEDLTLSLWFSLRNAMIRIDSRNAKRNLRPLLDEAGAERVLEILRAPSEAFAVSWVRRLRGYQEKLRQGLPEELAEIYRNLGRRAVISYSEKRIFEQARTLLSEELVLVWPDAEKRMKEAARCIR